MKTVKPQRANVNNEMRFKRKITPCDGSILTAVRLFDIDPVS